MLEFDELVEREGLEALRPFFPFIGPFDFSKTNLIMDKADGSLISTFEHNGVRVKSKTSLASEQAVAAQRLINSNQLLKTVLEKWVAKGYTVNMEYVAPSNRIVVAYEKPQLIILNIRHNDTGDYVDPATVDDLTRSFWVECVATRTLVDEYGTMQNFVEQIGEECHKEGYVIQLNDNNFVKIKTAWYLTRHRAKDSINSTRRLFEAVLDEAVDDIRSLFYDDPAAIQRINEVQEKTDKLYNHLIATVEQFYEANKHLDRKSYAILGQAQFTDGTFGLVMSKYLGKDAGVKEFLKKNYKKYGFTDEVTDE